MWIVLTAMYMIVITIHHDGIQLMLIISSGTIINVKTIELLSNPIAKDRADIKL